MLAALSLSLCLLGPAPPASAEPAQDPEGQDSDREPAEDPAGEPAHSPVGEPAHNADGDPKAPPPTLPDAQPAWTPPAGSSAQPASASPGPQPEPEPEPDYELRGREDMPYGATAARKSALHRGNEALVRPFRKPVYSAAAAFRFGVLAGGGTDVMQPLGYGFGAQIRAHFAPLYRARFGLELHAGHTRWSERDSFEDVEGISVTRTSLLSATDLSLGPSFEVPLGPVFVQLGGSAGMAVSNLTRPISANSLEDEGVSAINFALRGGLSLGVPVFRGHGLSLSGSVHHIFSPREVLIDLAEPDGDQTRPFGTSVEVAAAYTIWF